jgi:prepilin-type N-terminal cleavage/methylation domain-containing protein
MRPTAGRPRRGFSLPELMIAIMVLSIGVLALSGSMLAMMRYQELASNRAEMVSMGDSKLEDLRGAGVSQSADTVQLAVGGSLTSSTALHCDTLTSARGRVYYRRWVVVAGPVASTRDVQLRVSPQVKDRATPIFMDVHTMVIIYF